MRACVCVLLGVGLNCSFFVVASCAAAPRLYNDSGFGLGPCSPQRLGVRTLLHRAREQHQRALVMFGQDRLPAAACPSDSIRTYA
jgi:hypothetical protein